MKFVLMMNTPCSEDYQMMSWPTEDIEAHIAFMMGFSQKLSAAGELVGAEGLASPAQAKRVRADQDGLPVTDGIFPESKEFLAGYWIVDVERPERAHVLERAGECASAATLYRTATGKTTSLLEKNDQMMRAARLKEATR